MEGWTGPQEHESDSINQWAPFKLRAMNLENIGNSLFWKLNLFCWKAWARSWTILVLPASSWNFQTPDPGIASCGSSGPIEHLLVPWTCLSVKSMDKLLNGVSQNLMYMLRAIFFHIWILLARPPLLFLCILTLTSQLCRFSWSSLRQAASGQLSCGLWCSLVHFTSVTDVNILVHRACYSILGSYKTPAYDNWKQDISAGKCFIPCGAA